MFRLVCKYCLLPATHFAAQSTDGGTTVEFIPICRREIAGWNSGGDWPAPIFEITGVVPHQDTL